MSLDGCSTYKFKSFDEYISVGCNGLVKIVYSYLPQDIKMTDTVYNFAGRVSTRTFALAVASEYCFISNIFDDAKIWHERFCESIKNNLSKKGNIYLAKRKWL